MISLFNELPGLLHFKFNIMLINGWSESDLFNMNDMLLLFTDFLFFTLLIPVFAIIHDTANRRRGIWRNFDQIQIMCFGNLKRFFDGLNAYLLTIRTDKPNFLGSNFFIQTNMVLFNG